MTTAASTTAGAGGTDRTSSNVASTGPGEVPTMANGTDGTAAGRGNAGIRNGGRSPKISVGSASNADAAAEKTSATSTAIVAAVRGTVVPTATQSNAIFPGWFVAQAPLPVIGHIFQYDDIGLVGDFAQTLKDADEHAEFVEAYLDENFSVLELAFALSVDRETRDEARRLLEMWVAANRARVASYYDKVTAEKALHLQPLFRADDGGGHIFNPVAVFCNPFASMWMDDAQLLERFLSAGAGHFGINSLYGDLGQLGALTDDGATLVFCCMQMNKPECFKWLMDQSDIDLYRPKPGEKLISSSFGCILTREILESGPLRKGDMDLTEHFIRHPKCDVNVVGVDGFVALHWTLVALTQVGEDGSFKNQLNRCLASIVVLVAGGADVDGGAHVLSPQAVALRGIASADAETAARCHLALEAMRGHVSVADCCDGLEKTAGRISWLLSHRLGFLVGPFLFMLRMFRKPYSFISWIIFGVIMVLIACTLAIAQY